MKIVGMILGFVAGVFVDITVWQQLVAVFCAAIGGFLVGASIE